MFKRLNYLEKIIINYYCRKASGYEVSLGYISRGRVRIKIALLLSLFESI